MNVSYSVGQFYSDCAPVGIGEPSLVTEDRTAAEDHLFAQAEAYPGTAFALCRDGLTDGTEILEIRKEVV